MSPFGSGRPTFFQSISRVPDWPGYSHSHDTDTSESEEFVDNRQEVDDDEKLNSPSLSLVQRRKRSSVLVILGMSLVALLGALVGWFGAQKLSINKPAAISTQIQQAQVMEKPCGETPAQARARGCYFDVISFCWLPERCYDAELSQRFDGLTEWEWFVDPNRTQPLTHQQIMTGEHTGLYVNWEYHLLHCTCMWEKMHRALMGPHEKMAIDSYIGSYEHTKHCGHMLTSDRDVQLDVINTIILVKYPDCGMS
ncbi:hypothetical protein MGU_07131 [Metarhizium guizhouense ARSEF 977]|uniref:Uncharacterized protein n=1 Tax=Metarhizium guizhouense (strain ARSEF 977) TaxID=1276136 RepID=A0A0B4I0B0_METGA|nr:hypothetical protein MGU_07131 [Metarhizium guizhouense ARSEF 977]